MQETNAYKALNILHKAMLMGQVLFTAVCFYLLYSKSVIPSLHELDKTLQVITIIFSVAGFIAGNFLFKKRLPQAKESSLPLKEKFAIYRSGCIIQWALLEAPALLSVVSFFLTGNYAFIALTAMLIILFTVLGPSKIKTAFQLGVSEEDIASL
jgi:hypothetical protein